jgi:hypothetical protein
MRARPHRPPADDPTLTSSDQCAGSGFDQNADFVPGLVPVSCTIAIFSDIAHVDHRDAPYRVPRGT